MSRALRRAYKARDLAALRALDLAAEPVEARQSIMKKATRANDLEVLQVLLDRGVIADHPRRVCDAGTSPAALEMMTAAGLELEPVLISVFAGDRNWPSVDWLLARGVEPGPEDVVYLVRMGGLAQLRAAHARWGLHLGDAELCAPTRTKLSAEMVEFIIDAGATTREGRTQRLLMLSTPMEAVPALLAAGVAPVPEPTALAIVLALPQMPKSRVPWLCAVEFQ